MPRDLDERASLPEGYERRLALARLALAWGGLWRAVWPASGLAGLFLALALVDWLTALPGWLHLFVLAASAAGIACLVWRERAELSLPTRESARRRLELRALVPHRPLAALEDRLAAGAGDPVAEAAWRLHRAR